MRRRRLAGTIAGTALLAVLAIASVAIGSRTLPPAEVLRAVFAFDPSSDIDLIVWELRIPRTLLAVLVGLALGAAGVVMQAVTRNPLAEPGLLGINAGAAAAVATSIAVFGTTTVGGYIWAAFAGAAAASVLVFALGGALGRGTNPVKLVLAGAALSVVLGAYTTALLINFPSTFDSFRFWAVGSLQGRGWDVLPVAAVAIAVGVVLAAAIARSLDGIALGDDLANSLGVSRRRTWAVAAVAVVVLAGAATAAVGPIAFIGLTAPIVARSLVGPVHVWLLPVSMLIAAVVVLAADVLGRLVLQPSEAETAIMTALIGGPFFIAIVRRRRLVRL